MNYAKLAINEAQRIRKEQDLRFFKPETFLRKKRERIYRRLSESLKDFNGLTLASGRKMFVEMASIHISPCIRLVELIEFEGGEEKHPLVNIFIDITNDEADNQVQMRAECLWLEIAPVRITCFDFNIFMVNLAKQIGTIL